MGVAATLPELSEWTIHGFEGDYGLIALVSFDKLL